MRDLGSWNVRDKEAGLENYTIRIQQNMSNVKMKLLLVKM